MKNSSPARLPPANTQFSPKNINAFKSEGYIYSDLKAFFLSCNSYAFTLQYLCFYLAITMLLPCNIYVIRMRKLSFCVAISTLSFAKAWLLPCRSTLFSNETAISRLFTLIFHFGKALRQPSLSPKTASQGEAFAMPKCKHRSASAYTLTPRISPYY